MGTVTISGSTFDIYGTQAGATAYLVARLDAGTWTTASADTQARALVQATRILQPYLADAGFDLPPSDPVDVEIENANYELAFALVADPTVANKTSSGNNTKRLKAGSAEIEYFRPEAGGRFPTLVQQILNAWITAQGGSSSSGSRAFVSGGGECSSVRDYDLTEGY